MTIFARALVAVLLAFAALFVMPGAARAIDLEAARAQGLVGETPRGYVAPVTGSSPEVTALVNRVNSARRAEYQKVAQRTASSLEQVEILAAQKLYNQVPAGTYVQAAGGGWVRK